MIPAYLINLAKDDERLRSSTEQFAHLGLTPERIEAIDGRQLTGAEFKAFCHLRPRGGKKGWLPGQAGCLLSHRAAWRRIAGSNAEWAAVFEDDLRIADDLRDMLVSDTWIPNAVDLVRLEPSTNRVWLKDDTRFSRGSRDILRVGSTSWCAGAYLIHRETAKRLVALDPVHHQPADMLLFSFEDSVLAPTLAIFQCEPAPCIQDKFLNRSRPAWQSNIETGDAKSTLLRYMAQMKPSALRKRLERTRLKYRRTTYRRFS
ncbi:glycosyltransferase family 25 protein [Marinobacter fonticola]|uniref:glycosyltransferase family 25 protein n=1 Tax=Marinobacter fonticola TaxID=2603215 RepID=UPI0011E7F036|nr:glycosyltransferase family 25 protein [Marinobacter fonticola]